MSNLHIDVYEHAGLVTVQQMRVMIARAVSRLKGDNQVYYSFDYLLPKDRVMECSDDRNFGSAPMPVTVSLMRRHLAKHLSRLDGTNPVTFSFHCKVEVSPATAQGLMLASRTITEASEIA